MCDIKRIYLLNYYSINNNNSSTYIVPISLRVHTKSLSLIINGARQLPPLEHGTGQHSGWDFKQTSWFLFERWLSFQMTIQWDGVASRCFGPYLWRPSQSWRVRRHRSVGRVSWQWPDTTPALTRHGAWPPSSQPPVACWSRQSLPRLGMDGWERRDRREVSGRQRQRDGVWKSKFFLLFVRELS